MCAKTLDKHYIPTRWLAPGDDVGVDLLTLPDGARERALVPRRPPGAAGGATSATR